MRTTLIIDQVWTKITDLVKEHPGECMAAISYFGSGGSQLLPLTEGSTLIINMSEQAVKAGLTNPSEIQRLLEKGVEVHTVKNLHAKIVVIGKTALVGSANASKNSKATLIEAVMKTDQPNAAKKCKDFINSLKGELVTPEYARRLAKLYKPPNWGFPGSGSGDPRAIPQHSPLWLVPVAPANWDGKDLLVLKKGKPIARRRLTSVKRYKIDEFMLDSNPLLKFIRDGDLIMQIFTGQNRAPEILPAGRVLYVKKYKKYGATTAIVFIEQLVSQNPKKLRTIQERAPAVGNILSDVSRPRKLRDNLELHTLLNLWRGSGELE
jgi:PLD-like domain